MDNTSLPAQPDDNKVTASDEGVEPTQNPADFAAEWLAKVDGASKEEEDWRKEGKRICNIYVPKNTGKASFYNILYGNIDVLLPVLYSNTPSADVRRRFGSSDPVARFAAMAIERVIEYQLSEYDFDYRVELCVLDALLPGRGQVRIKYTPVTGQQTDQFGNTFEKLLGEYAECDYVKWEDFRRSAGKVWDDVTWVAYRSYPSEEDAEKAFGADVAKKLNYNVVVNQSDGGDYGEKQKGQANRSIVWEIWDKLGGEIIFVAESYKGAPLKRTPPPTQHKEFFDCPRPLQFILRTDSLVPYPEYQEYRQQADQLAKISQRIASITNALKIRGIYDSTMKELERLFDADDNDMLPVENVAAMYEKGGVEKMIWLLPIEKLATALQYLYQVREQTKSVIYELSGVSDILRGEGKASDTLGAQQIKVQYANTRLKRRQKEIQRFIRDIFRLKAEVVAENFQPETIAKIVNLNGQELQAAKVNPQDILQLLQDDTMRDYKIDVESDSMVALEDQDAQQQVSTFFQAINQFFGMAAPLIQTGVLPVEVAKQILLQVSRKFKMGDEFEEALDQMQPPTPPSVPPTEQAKIAVDNKRIDVVAQDNAAKNDIERVKVAHDIVKSGADAHHATSQKHMTNNIEKLKLAQPQGGASGVQS